MSTPELLELMQTHHPTASKAAFDKYYSRLAGIATRYAKSTAQADELFNVSFHASLLSLRSLRQPPLNLDDFIEREFIVQAIAFIKSIRSEYYVSSTVHATSGASTRNYDLFDSAEVIDYRQIGNELLIKGIQNLVPSQRLIFNLHVIDGYSLTDAALLLEASDGTVKSNLEKARFNLQKNIDKSLKSVKA
jgi:RNA polymerase sigma-70 factor (ECF subfamily)